MEATFNGNPRSVIISFNIPNNVREETEVIAFYDDLSSLVRSIPKHNVLVIGAHMNAQNREKRKPKIQPTQLVKLEWTDLTDFTIENRLTFLKTNFQKREGKLWSYIYENNTEAQRDYVYINKKWKNSAINCNDINR